MATNPAIAMPGQAAEELDPITFEVLRNAFEYTCGRMTTILQRTSFSPILSDMLDFSNAIYDSQVRLLGQSGNPVHLAAMQYSADASLAKFPIAEMRPGDVIVSVDNRPVSSAQEFGELLERGDFEGGILLRLVRNGIRRYEILKIRD